MESNCKANELQAYQAGIDVCKKDKVKKLCADLKETAEYTSNMKNWENIKHNPPNCAEPAKETEKEKTSEPKKGETEKKPKEPEKKPSTK